MGENGRRVVAEATREAVTVYESVLECAANGERWKRTSPDVEVEEEEEERGERRRCWGC